MGFDRVQRVKVGDQEVAFREAGSGAPLLLVHGWPLASSTWRKVVPGLDTGARCIALDLLGAGESLVDPERDLGLRAQAALVAGFVDALGLEQVTLVGHDSGGSVARGFAVEHPDRVARLVLADTEVPGHRAWLVTLLQRVSALPGSASLLGATLGSKTLARSPLGFWSSFADLGAFDFDEFFETVVAPGVRSERARACAGRFLKDFDWDEVDAVGERYHRLRMPKCLIWGEKDRFFPVAEGRKLAQMLPEPTRFELVPDAGLFVHEERPGEWVRIVRSFLASS